MGAPNIITASTPTTTIATATQAVRTLQLPAAAAPARPTATATAADERHEWRAAAGGHGFGAHAGGSSGGAELYLRHGGRPESAVGRQSQDNRGDRQRAGTGTESCQGR